MKLCKIEELMGGEVLARPILTDEYRILLSEETVLKEEYIEKIRELGIEEIYIKDQDMVHAQEVVLLKADIETSFREKVRDILGRHTYNNSGKLSELIKTADGIIENILNEEEVVEKIFDIRERSADIYEHSISICSLATLIALKLELNKETVHEIGVGALLHELGLRYLTIPFEGKEISSLSEEEQKEYYKHPVYGYSAIKKESWISETGKNIILGHHERIDGSGFPLKIKKIPYETQIVSVCDAFDEMICGIGCTRMKVYEAVEYMRVFKGKIFDEKLVDLFLDFTAVYPAGTVVFLNDGREATVLRQNKEFPDRPVIKIKGLFEETDLTKVQNLFIEKVIE